MSSSRGGVQAGPRLTRCGACRVGAARDRRRQPRQRRNAQARLIDRCCWACRHVDATQPASCCAHASGTLGGDQRTARLPRLRRAVLVRGALVCVDGPDSKPDTYDHDHPGQQRGTGMPDSGGFRGAEDHLRRGQAPASPRGSGHSRCMTSTTSSSRTTCTAAPWARRTRHSSTAPPGRRPRTPLPRASGADLEPNWRPAPDRFSLNLRAYGGQEPVRDGSWTPPMITTGSH